MKIVSTEKRVIKMWSDNIEEGAIKQLKNLANLPFVFKWVCAMPDCHQGYGMPIGGVLATKGVIIPNAVGKDIGCGMCAVKTSLTEIDTNTLKKIMGEIRGVVPVGFKHHKEKQNRELMPLKDTEEAMKLFIVNSEFENARTQIGTLGGGNNFIEIQKGSDGYIWIMIHSGSRNLGFKVADYYNKLAISLNEKWYSSVPKKWELAFLPIESDEAKAYLREMNYCIEFALANRELMMDRIIDIFFEYTMNSKKHKFIKDDNIKEGIQKIIQGEGSFFDETINIAHNYASCENHFGQNVWVHRKGATLAREGTLGIIPGSQGTASFIVEGLGNPDSFMSCSHGAGRRMGRKQAIRTLDLKEQQDKLNKKGIIHSIRSKENLDEAPDCYKPIEEVMKHQENLVKILVRLEPLGVIKG